MKDYKFDGRVSLEVLNNYLDRAMTFSGISYASAENLKIHIDALLNMGVKHVARAGGWWTATDYDTAHYNHIKRIAITLIKLKKIQGLLKNYTQICNYVNCFFGIFF